MLFNELIRDATGEFKPRFGKETTKLLEDVFKPEITSPTKVGIEIEVENVAWQAWKTSDAALRALYDSFWTVHEDGSLRNHGSEFVTLIGMTASQASTALKVLEAVMARICPKATANARTGVHIHLNFLDKTAKDVGAFLALYVLFEKSLFEFSGSRVQNIFCVPVRDSINVVGNMLRSARKNPKDAKSIWTLSRASPKYLACNVGALGNFGTIELRHAAGTNRPTSVLPWLETVTHLYDYAAKQDLEALFDRIRDLNTTSLYESLMKEALPRFMIRKLGEPAIVQDMINGCAYLKEALIAPEEVGVTPFVPDPRPARERPWELRLDEVPAEPERRENNPALNFRYWTQDEALELGFSRFPDPRFRMFGRIAAQNLGLGGIDSPDMGRPITLVDDTGMTFYTHFRVDNSWARMRDLAEFPTFGPVAPPVAVPDEVARFANQFRLPVRDRAARFPAIRPRRVRVDPD